MVRSAVYKDLSRIAEIHVFGWRNAYRGIVTDDFLFNKLSVRNSLERYEKKWEMTNDKFYVNEDNGIINGFMIFGSCRDSDKPEAFELYAIYVEPLMLHQGIGRKLLEKFESIGIESGYSENIVWVFKENIQARKFYEKMGYKEEGKEQKLEEVNAIEMRYYKKLK